jgi:uncharacterized membrane protein YphA (DoxX/SURF4 family)
LFSLSRLQLFFFLLSILILRLVVGAHFFYEGITKLKSGNFTSKYFLLEARGPWSQFFQRFLDDPNGITRLCLKTETPLSPTSAELSDPQISPAFTFMIWRDFADQILTRAQLQKAPLQAATQSRLDQLQREAQKTSDLNHRESLTEVIEQEKSRLRLVNEFPSSVDFILAEHQKLLQEFLDDNQTELIAYFGSQERLVGSARDGQNREAAAQQVASLREQVDSVRLDRQRKFQAWTTQVEAIWNSLENQLNELERRLDQNLSPTSLHRPFAQPYSWQKTIDRTIPWFDTLVGALLIVGLLTRSASLAAAGFLASVIATQPPWIPGASPTILYLVELSGCLVLCTAAAGRIGGLDYILHQAKFWKQPSTSGNDVARGPRVLT